MSRPVSSTFGLVVSRLRYDLGRHAAAAGAVATLMATALLFQGVALGMEQGLDRMVETEEPNELLYAQTGFFAERSGITEDDLAEVRAWPGVANVSARASLPTDIPMPDGVRLVFAAGIDPEADADLVVQGEPPAPQDEQIRVFRFGASQDSNYTLVEGRWIAAADEAVITWSLKELGWQIGSDIVLPTAFGNRTFHVVGIILDDHPAAAVSGAGFPGGHAVVANTALGATTYQSMRVRTDPTYAAVSGVAELMRGKWPESWRDVRPQVEAFEKRHFDALRTAAVLDAAGRFLAATGAGTMFALSLLLLTAERRSIGVFAALGLGARRASLYAYTKMTIVTATGIAGGTALGAAALRIVPLPALGYTFAPALSATAWLTALVLTVVAALAGTAVAVLRVRRVPAIEALRFED